MTVAVHSFIDRHWDEVLDNAEAWRWETPNRDATLERVRKIHLEWEAIPLEEKQIAYVPFESHFWAVLNLLHLCAVGRAGIHSAGAALPESFDETLAQSLSEAAKFMQSRQPMPQKYVGRRHLP